LAALQFELLGLDLKQFGLPPGEFPVVSDLALDRGYFLRLLRAGR